MLTLQPTSQDARNIIRQTKRDTLLEVAESLTPVVKPNGRIPSKIRYELYHMLLGEISERAGRTY